MLVHLSGRQIDAEDPAEFQALVSSAGAEPVAEVEISISRPNPRHFIGRGKLADLVAMVAEQKVELVLFNHVLSPSQERNLERELKARVIDRTGLILDIFAQRARTHEGKLQVELAQLDYLSTRLVRGWTHLERQKGGIGLRGPGETQLETDRRLLRDRMQRLRGQLDKVRRQRALGRRARERAEVPVVSLIGYTNAGKSTLFNRLTKAQVLTEDRLFATLDPTLRKLDLAPTVSVVLADTVGFIRHLPHTLVEAFQATLEETLSARLLLHVIDAAEPERDAHFQQVQSVLKEIGAQDIPQLLVYNKIDQMEALVPGIERDSDGNVRAVRLSAVSGAGLELLPEAIQEALHGRIEELELPVSPAEARLRARLYQAGVVVGESSADNGGWLLRVRVSPAMQERLGLAGRDGTGADK